MSSGPTAGLSPPVALILLDLDGALDRPDPDLRAGIDALLAALRERGWQIQETASPPTCYLPAEDVDLDRLEPANGSTLCE